MFVPPLLGTSVRILRPDLANPELALPTLLCELLPAWLGALGLAALFAAEVSTADAVLFMLSTSLARDLYQSFLDRQASAARLLRVGRLAVIVAGTLGVGLALRFPSVIDALKAFYGILTAALFVPLLGGMISTRRGPVHAWLAIVLAVGATLAGPWLVAWSGWPAWAPTAVGLLLAALVFPASAVGPVRSQALE